MRIAPFFRALTASAVLAATAMMAVPASAATPIVTLSAFGDPDTLPGWPATDR